MNKRYRVWRKAGCLMGVLLVAAAAGMSQALAAPYVNEDFTLQAFPASGKIVQESNSRRGFVLSGTKRLDEGGIEYRNTGFSSKEGAIQVLLARSSLKREMDFIFRIDGGFRVYLDWARDLPRVAFDDVSGTRPNAKKTNDLVWGDNLIVPSSPPVGEWFVLTISWGSGTEGNQVYIDGIALKPLDPPRGGKPQPVFNGSGRLVLGSDEKYIVANPDIWANGRTTMTMIGGIKIHRNALSAAEVAASATAWLANDAALSIVSVEHDAARVAGFSGQLVAGNAMTVSLAGTPGAAGTFDVAHYPDLDRKIALAWRGWGVYLEKKVFFDESEVNLRDVEGYRVYVSTAPFDPLAPGFDPVQELDVKEQSCLLENLEIGTPYYAAVVAEMRDGTLRTVVAPIANRPLSETTPGIYSGIWTAGYLDRYPRAVVVGRLTQGMQSANLTDTDAFTVDPALTIAVATSPSELKADEKSKSKITVKVTDANGNPVAGHKMKFLLATTSQYTGVVGGGAFTEQVGGTVSEDRWGETDLFGNLTATYFAGFAAKTALIVVRDMASNDTGAGWVKTYITATAQLELLPASNSAAMAAGYAMTVTSSDRWLTADGRSQARITAKVTLNRQPVEGHQVVFNIPSGAGSIRTVQGATDRNGEARAVYTAGMKIGIVLIAATDNTAGISGSVSIELRSDAPAQIAIKIDPEKLPADGSSRAKVEVLVTDINDNPNDNVQVEYAITQGGGRLREKKALTDRRGESTNTYTAGSSPGLVSIDITVRSTEPTMEEIGKARNLAVAVPDSRFF